MRSWRDGERERGAINNTRGEGRPGAVVGRVERVANVLAVAEEGLELWGIIVAIVSSKHRQRTGTREKRGKTRQLTSSLDQSDMWFTPSFHDLVLSALCARTRASWLSKLARRCSCSTSLRYTLPAREP